METKKEYIAPKLRVMSYETELGYAASILNILTSAFTGLNTSSMETFTIDEDNTFGEGAIDW